MFQSCISSTQSKNRGASDSGTIVVSPLRTASPAAFDSRSTLTHHCIDRRGSIGSPERSLWPTLCRYRRTSLTMRPCSARASRIALRAAKRSRPSNCVPVPTMWAVSSITVGIGRSWRWPSAKSFGSWAGVIFTAPEPNSGST